MCYIRFGAYPSHTNNGKKKGTTCWGIKGEKDKTGKKNTTAQIRDQC
jgi:hypothetical protein